MTKLTLRPLRLFAFALLVQMTTAAIADAAALTPEAVCAGVAFVDASGTARIGRRTCQSSPSPRTCTEDGEVNCIATERVSAGVRAAIAPEDLRRGVTAGGIEGTLRTTCRNGASRAISDWSAPIPGIQVISVDNDRLTVALDHTATFVPAAGQRVRVVSSPACQLSFIENQQTTMDLFIVDPIQDSLGLALVPGGVPVENWSMLCIGLYGFIPPVIGLARDDRIDTWDAVADSAAGPGQLPTDLPLEPSGAYVCDASTWLDVSREGGSPAACSTASVDCMMRETSTGLTFSEMETASGTAVVREAVDAAFYCASLVFGDRDDWRLPTHKEALVLAMFGANALSRSEWIASDLDRFNTATIGAIAGDRVQVDVFSGVTSISSSTARTFCVAD